MRRLLVLSAVLAAVFAARSVRSEGDAVRQFSVANIEYKGSKLWIPGTLIVKAGETVKIKLVNSTPSGKHGYAIDAFGVKTEVANDGQPASVEFKAAKAGLYPIYCQLHPAHIGGQLLVLEK
ncbi:MAG: cupredoxin domain-containing protein [Elusimicrobia bacterium]|nr:cupredoxin domain-containing protein [Elusimicrobiota bacterium]